MLKPWPASHTFRRDKRVIVTGLAAARRTSGSGCLGAFIVDALHARGVAGMLTPRRQRLEH